MVSDEWADAPYVDQNCQTDVNIRHEHAIEAIYVHLSTLQTSTFVGRTWVTYFRSSQGVRTGYERWRVDSVRIANGYLYPDRLSRLACTMQ